MVTIIIPVYCTSVESLNWLEECLDSAVNCSPIVNVYVWDDGSTVDIEPITELYGKRIRLVGRTEENHGPAYARNRLAEAVTTELIFPLDCDDVIHPAAIRELLLAWDGTPLFPDLWKFGTHDDPHFQLLTWTCINQRKKLGIAPVNVLQSKEQWEALGGWDESFKPSDLYEDAEYNARLFLTYCAKNLHKPLIGYRQHKNSRTFQYQQQAAADARKMLRRIGGYFDMGCCGKKRRSPSNAPEAAAARGMAPLLSNPENLPGVEGDRVLVQYVSGDGKLMHYIRGKATQYPYKVKFGDYLYIDSRDARTEGQAASDSPFVIVT